MGPESAQSPDPGTADAPDTNPTGPRLGIRFEHRGVDHILTKRGESLKRRLSVPVLVAATGVIPLLILEEWIHPQSDSAWFLAANWAIWAVFSVELAVMLAVTPRRGAYLRHSWLDVVIVVFTFPLLPHLLLALRMLRLLAVLKHLRTALGRVFTLAGLQYVLAILVGLVIVGGVIFSRLEDQHSVADGIWWAVVTATSVGYGDLVPSTSAGRVLATGLMALGLAVAALLTAVIAAHIVDSEEDSRLARRFERQQAETEAIRAQLKELTEAVKRL